METIWSGSVVVLRRENTVRDFCFLDSRVAGSDGLRMAERDGEWEGEVEKLRRRRW